MDGWILQTSKWLAPLRRGRDASARRRSAETTLDQLVRGQATEDPASNELRDAFQLSMRLGRALLSFGLPAQRLEDALQRVAAALGFGIDCFSTPTALIVTFSDETRRMTRVVRAEPGDTDLERLSALHALVGRVERRELSAAEASRRLDVILARPPRYRGPIVVAAYGLVSASAAVLLGGGIGDLGPAVGLGVLVGLLASASRRVPTLGRIMPALATLAATLIARAVHLAGVPVHEPVLVLASVIMLLPGFTLTIATVELATANVVSGTSRLVGALATLVQMAFGAALGARVAQQLATPPEIAAWSTPAWMTWVGYGFAVLGFAVVLRVKPRDVPAVVVMSALAVGAAQLGRAWLGPEIGAFLGALVIGLASHVHARTMDRPVLLLLTPGILMMVPGSLGFLSVSSMLQSDVVTSLETAFRMILIATSLAAGLLVATVAVPPRRAL